MAQNHVEDNIYYDNMEMMEKIEKSRNIVRSPPKKLQEKTLRADQRKSMQNVEKPPALPPKKKNLKKAVAEQTDRKVENKNSQILKNTNLKTPEKVVEQVQLQPTRTWTHPGILRTRSIVDEPLSPILEEESVLCDSQQGSPVCSDNESSDRRSITTSDVFQSDSSVFYEACGDSAKNESFTENSFGEHSDNISVNSHFSENQNKMNGISRKIPPANGLTLEDEKFYSGSESSNSGGNFPTMKSFPEATENLSNNYESDDSVQPYGMVDLASLEKVPEVKRSALSPMKQHFSSIMTTRKAANDVITKINSPISFNMMYDDTTVYDNIDDYNGTHSTAVSSLDKRGVSTANQSASPKPRSKFFAKSASPQNYPVNERHSINTRKPDSNNERSQPIPSPKPNKPKTSKTTSNVTAYNTSQPLHEKLPKNDLKRLPLPPKPVFPKSQIFNVVPDHKDLYKDDVNMYEEIHPKIDLNINTNSPNDEMEKALNDIQEILKSMDIPDVFNMSPQTLATKKFPVAKEDQSYEPPQYDNFSSMISANKSKSEEGNFKNTAQESQSRNMTTPEIPPFTQRNKMFHETENFQENQTFGINRPFAMTAQFTQVPTGSVKPTSLKSDQHESITTGAMPMFYGSASTSQKRIGLPTTHLIDTTNISTMSVETSEAKNFKKSLSSPVIATEERSNEVIQKAHSTNMYRKSKSLDDAEKTTLAQTTDETPRRTKSRESDGDSGMYSQNVGDITDEGLTVRSGSQYSDESMLDTSESLKGSTRSLGRLNSRESKKSPLRSKFKFRGRSKSQDRLQSDSQAQQSGNSDVDEDSKSRRRKGSRLSRRISRKTMERRGRSADRKSGDENTGGESRGPVNFIRKLLRKSREPTDDSQTSKKNDPPVSGPNLNEQTPDSTSIHSITSSQQSYQQEDPPREKHLISPPSRRARKMLHSRRARDYVSSSDDDTDTMLKDREGYDTKSAKHGPHRNCVTPDVTSFRNRRRTPGQNNPPSTSDSEHELSVSSDTKGPGFGDCNDRRKNTFENEKERNNRPHRAQHGRRRSEKRRLHSDSTFPTSTASQQQEKYKTLVSLNAQTLKKITEKWLTEWRNQLPVGGFLITSWSDVVLTSKRPQCVLGKSVIYVAHFSTNPDHKLACQIFHQRDVNSRLVRQLENCSTLTAHPNLCSVCSHFPCQIPGSLLNPSYGDRPINALCVVLANVPAMSLGDYMRRLAEEKEQKQVHKQIILMLLQLLQALDNLSSSGFRIANIRPDHLVVTQERGLLQILPHMDCADEQDIDGNMQSSQENLPIIQQIARLISWMLDMGVNIHAPPIQRPQVESTHLFALQKVVFLLTEQSYNIDSRLVQSLAQCAIWGPMTSEEIDLTYKNTYEALEMWVDMKQAKLVNSIAVLFSGKSNSVPIYMFYKHQYFSQITPESLYQNLKILERI